MSLKLVNNVFPVFLVLVLCSSPCRSVATLSVSYREDGGGPRYLSFILMFKGGWIATIYFICMCVYIHRYLYTDTYRYT